MCMSFAEYMLTYRGYVKRAIKSIWEPIRWNAFFIAKSNGYTGNSITDFWPLDTDDAEDSEMDYNDMVESWNKAIQNNGFRTGDQNNG